MQKRKISRETQEKYLKIAERILLRSSKEEVADGPLLRFLADIVSGGVEDFKHFEVKAFADAIIANGDIAGDRVCQDWPPEDSSLPHELLTEQEQDDLNFNYELYNSKGKGYEQGADLWFGDEMFLSYAIAVALKDIQSGVLDGE